MKKHMIWITMTALMLTLCACRPAAQTGGAGSSPEGGTGVSEEAGGLNEQVDENAKNTETGALLGEEGEESAENTLIPEESEEGSEVTITEPAENEEEAEVTLPATTTEDPALRAEAERIRKEQGTSEYMDFCREKDIKVMIENYNIDEDVYYDLIYVYLKKSVSAQNKPAPDFSCIEYETITEKKVLYDQVPTSRGQIFMIKLKQQDKQNLLTCIEKLNQLDYVWMVSPVPVVHLD